MKENNVKDVEAKAWKKRKEKTTMVQLIAFQINEYLW